MEFKNICGKISNKREAITSVSILWDKILHAPLLYNTCECKTPLCFGSIMSYGHDGGIAVPGFEAPQWFYIHCVKCGHDTAITHIGIELDELDLRCKNNIWDNMDVCENCVNFNESYADHTLENDEITSLAHHWCKLDGNETARKTKMCNKFCTKE
jgi:hypothetical protein